MRFDPKGNPEELGVPRTAERLALGIAIGAVHRELTKDEHLIAVSIGDFFGSDFTRVHNELDDLRRNLNAMADRLLELYRQHY